MFNISNYRGKCRFKSQWDDDYAPIIMAKVKKTDNICWHKCTTTETFKYIISGNIKV